MPRYCVVTNCNSVSNLEEGISLHTIPFHGDERREAVKRRKRWVDFVCLHRKQWSPSQWSAVCSKHFRPEDYERQFGSLQGMEKTQQRLRRDELGIVVFPTIFSSSSSTLEEPSVPSSRTRRKIMRELAIQEEQPCSSRMMLAKDAESAAELSEVKEESDDQDTDQALEELEETASTEELAKLLSEQRKLKNKIITLRTGLAKRRTEFWQEKKKRKRLELKLQDFDDEDDDDDDHENDDDNESDELTDDDVDVDPDVSDPITEPESEYMETEEETDTSGTDADADDDQVPRVFVTDTDNLRTQPKFIVFFTSLMMLFKVCHACGTKDPLLESKELGTMVQVTTQCANPKCPKRNNVWRSQPNMPGTRVPTGNFLLCMAILLSGGSATKVFTIFKHMGLRCISYNTYLYHQRTKLFPAILLFWKTYQTKMIEKVKALGTVLTFAGDGRHDSMGHSAKYGAYTMFCCTLPLILNFALIQRNQAGSSQAMEFMGFKEAMLFLLAQQIPVSVFISDRHTAIASHMKKELGNITHYFDLWHIAKKIRKVLLKISKESGGEDLVGWIRPAVNHFYWSATSTFSGYGALIWSKFRSFLDHIINHHKDLDDPLFNKCHHGDDIADRKWLKKDSILYEKVVKVLTKKSLVKGIKQASPHAQTSCLEGFHSVVNHFAPKMTAYSYAGQYCRHILAAIHFNYNLHREDKKKADGTPYVKVVYPKFKNGEATVRNIKVAPKFDYVEEIYQLYLERQGELKDAMEELKKMTPLPMDSVLPKEDRSEAIRKQTERQSAVVKDVPATGTVDIGPQHTEPVAKSKPHCKTCKRPMKGHKNLLDCPRNQQR